MTSSSHLVGALGVAGTVVFTVYGQLVIKWRLDQLAGGARDAASRSLREVAVAAFDPWILSGFVGAGIAAFFWLLALSRLPLSAAYPFMSLSFVLVLLLSGWILGEHVGIPQYAGVAVIGIGLAIGALA